MRSILTAANLFPSPSPAADQTAHTPGALAVDKLESIVIDASHIDQKKRGIMDMKDTMMPLARFLARKEFKSRFADVELSTEKKIKKQKPLAVLFY